MAELSVCPLGVGEPSIAEAPEVRIARQSSTGRVSVWVAGVGYLSTPEIRQLGLFLMQGLVRELRENEHPYAANWIEDWAHA